MPLPQLIPSRKPAPLPQSAFEAPAVEEVRRIAASMAGLSARAVFRISAYGRFGYTVMTIAFSIMFAPVAYLLADRGLLGPLWADLFEILMLVGFGAMALYSFLQLWKMSPRFECTPEGFTYRTPFERYRVAWADVESWCLQPIRLSNLPFVWLHVRYRKSINLRKYHVLDLSGMRPHYDELLKWFAVYAARDVPPRPPLVKMD